MAAEKILLHAEHVHGAALALGIAAPASGQLGHHALGFHSTGQHVTVITVSRYHLIAFFEGHLHADDDGFLSDIKMAEAADGAHSVELAGLFLEPADQQHVAERAKFLFPRKFRGGVGAVSLFLVGFFHDAFLGCSHGVSRLSERLAFSLAQLKPPWKDGVSGRHGRYAAVQPGTTSSK